MSRISSLRDQPEPRSAHQITPPDSVRVGLSRWTMRWRAALLAFDITFDGRLSAARD